MRKTRLMPHFFLGMAGVLFLATAGQTQSTDSKYRVSMLTIRAKQGSR